jgi:hypothetical protein
MYEKEQRSASCRSFEGDLGGLRENFRATTETRNVSEQG